MRSTRTQIIIFIFAIILIGIIVMITLLSMNPDSVPSDADPTPISDSPRIKPLTIRAAPTVALENGGGTDVNSGVVKSSIAEIDKLDPVLPFRATFTSSENIPVAINIPTRDLQANSWTLRVNIFGINYNTSPGEEDYDAMRKSFIEATGTVFTWIGQNNADPNKIIFVWGDKKFIREQAEKWLSSNN